MKTEPAPQKLKINEEPKGASAGTNPAGTIGCSSAQSSRTIDAQRYRLLADKIPDIVCSLDEYGMITSANQAVTGYGYTPEELIGERLVDIIHVEDRDRVMAAFFEKGTLGATCTHTQRFRLAAKSGTISWFEGFFSIEYGPAGEFLLHHGLFRDITEKMHSDKTLGKIREELKELVNIRTRELTQANDELQREILDRRETERILREREADLEMEKGNLEETNTALKVLIKRREVDKHEFEEQVLCNIKEFVLPYLDKLKGLSMDERQKAYLSILESNLSDITSPFSRRLSLDYFNLTPSERKTANFIRQGKKTREIAELLGLSKRTVEAYRLGIRKKLRLQNKKVNLRTYLSSIN